MTHTISSPNESDQIARKLRAQLLLWLRRPRCPIVTPSNGSRRPCRPRCLEYSLVSGIRPPGKGELNGVCRTDHTRSVRSFTMITLTWAGLLLVGAALLSFPLFNFFARQYRIWSCWFQLPHSPAAFSSLAGDVFEHHAAGCHKSHMAWSRLGNVVGLRLGPIPVRQTLEVAPSTLARQGD